MTTSIFREIVRLEGEGLVSAANAIIEREYMPIYPKGSEEYVECVLHIYNNYRRAGQYAKAYNEFFRLLGGATIDDQVKPMRG